MKTPFLIEQHFHGAYGIDFNKAKQDEILELSKKMYNEGFAYIFPTLVTDSVENIKRQLQIIKQAKENQTEKMAKICGVHLEGIFLNEQKKGIHNSKHFLKPTIENYKLLEDDIIKIVTLAPELCDENNNLIEYLKSKNIKVQAGHCIGGDLKGCNATTHTFNAMSGITHREKSTALSALIDDNIYTEIIADGVHVSDDALNLLFKVKPTNKILLVSDSLPCSHSSVKEFIFADEKVYYDGIKATSIDGTLAGSSSLLPDIIKLLIKKNMFNPQFVLNSYAFHNLEPIGEIDWE